jgi:CheY-like chemotaxis protein
MTSAHGAPTILLVEDDLDIQLLEKSILELEGFRVVVASNGREAATILRAESPNLILLDLTMPIMDGWEFLECHGQSLRARHIPVVVVSADFEVHRHGTSLHHAHALVRKPFNLDELLSIVYLHQNMLDPPASVLGPTLHAPPHH